MLDDLKQLLDLAYQARAAVDELRDRAATDSWAWQGLSRTLNALRVATDALLETYAEAVRQEKATAPTPEVVA